MARRAAESGLALPPRPAGAARQKWLYDALRRAILNGRLAPGARLPATRDLAREHGLARGTVTAAFEQLAAEGYVEGAVGRGTFVAKTLPDALLAVGGRRAARRSGAVGAPPLSRRGRRMVETPFLTAGRGLPVRAFRMALPDLAAFPLALWTRIAARRARASRPALLADGEAQGYAPLRAAIAAHLGPARGIVCSAEQIVIVASVQQALDLSARLLLDPGDAAWMEDPGYPGARLALAAAGARIIPVPVDGEGMDVVRGIARAPKARLAYVTAGRQAPLGMALSLDRRLALLRWAATADAFIFEDDYDSDYRFAGRPLAALKSLDGGERVIYAGTFSKLLFPALRLAYAVLPERLVDAAAAALSLTARHAPLMTQAVLHDFIAEGHLARHVRRMRMLYAERAAALQAAAQRHWADRLALPPIEAGLDVAAWLAPGLNEERIVAIAARAGIEVAGLARYAVKARPPAGLLLGFAAFDPAAIDAGAAALARVIAEVESMR
jgi:GntR family transcriptional regulator/MocR family aminotransferase